MRIRQLNNYDIHDITNLERIYYRGYHRIACADDLLEAKPNEAFIAQFKGCSTMSIVWKENGKFFSIVSTDFPELFFRHIDQLDDLLDSGVPARDAISFLSL